MTTRRRIALWALVAALAAGMSFVAAGCGGGDDDSDERRGDHFDRGGRADRGR